MKKFQNNSDITCGVGPQSYNCRSPITSPIFIIGNLAANCDESRLILAKKSETLTLLPQLLKKYIEQLGQEGADSLATAAADHHDSFKDSDFGSSGEDMIFCNSGLFAMRLVTPFNVRKLLSWDNFIKKRSYSTFSITIFRDNRRHRHQNHPCLCQYQHQPGSWNDCGSQRRHCGNSGGHLSDGSGRHNPPSHTCNPEQLVILPLGSPARDLPGSQKVSSPATGGGCLRRDRQGVWQSQPTA